MPPPSDKGRDPLLELALVIAEAATEAWMREQMMADATETIDKGANDDGGDAR